jgi:hypothetical protein
MIWFALIVFAALVGCEKQALPESKPTAMSEAESLAELSKMVKHESERHSALLAAKYHLPRATVEAITTDFRVHQFILLGIFTSPAPTEENMEQTIERLSTAHKVPTDVVSSLIIDDLLLDKAP